MSEYDPNAEGNKPTAIQTMPVSGRPAAFSLAPANLTEAMKFADMMAASEMVPKAFKGKPGDVLIAVQMGAEVGLQPMAAIQNIAVINGKPGLYGDAGKAILLAAGCIIEEADVEHIKATGVARCVVIRRGRPPVERTFSIEDAQKAGLWNKEGPWRTYPYRQMAWRAFWFAARDAAADLLKGLGGFEELADYGVMKDVTPQAERLPPAKPEYPAESFEKNLPEWRRLIAGGKSPDEIIDTVGLRYTMTEEQKKAVRAPDDTPKASHVTFAQVADALNGAKTLDELDASADLIREIKDAKQREELSAIYNENRSNLGG